MNQKIKDFIEMAGVVRDIIAPYFVGFIVGYIYCSIQEIDRDLDKINGTLTKTIEVHETK
jgi:hypothetical protein